MTAPTKIQTTQNVMFLKAHCAFGKRAKYEKFRAVHRCHDQCHWMTTHGRHS